MNKQNMKNMIVLKDLPSNLIDEAIVILKPSIKVKELNLKDNKKKDTKFKENSKNYIVNEAQMVISNYISNIEKDKKNEFILNKRIRKRYKISKIISILFGLAFIISLVIK